MSTRLWIACAGVVTASALAGTALAGFATGRYSGGLWSDRNAGERAADAEPPDGFMAFPIGGARTWQEAPDAPREPIVCKGCGPTLAERQMADDAYAVGDGDPALRDYEAGGAQPAETTESPGAPVDLLPRPAPVHDQHPRPAEGAKPLPVVPLSVAPTPIATAMELRAK